MSEVKEAVEPAKAEPAEAAPKEVTPAAEAPKAEPKQESMITSEEKKEEAKPEVKEAKPAVPEKYELKLPENSALKPEYLAKVESLAKEKGWSQERAQEAVDERSSWEAERAQEQVRLLTELNDKTWKEELIADPEFGGQKFDEYGHLAAKAIERFGGKEVLEKLKADKLNHNPTLFRIMARVGKAMESDKIVNTNQQQRAVNIPLEQRMYPDMFKKEA